MALVTGQRFAVGDTVRIRMGRVPLLARVLEDRGPLTPNRGQVIRVVVVVDEEAVDEPAEFELPASLVERA